jgi:hypothetical protein
MSTSASPGERSTVIGRRAISRRKKRGVGFRQAASPLADDEGVAQFKPPEARNQRHIHPHPLERQSRHRVVLVRKSPARRNRGVEDKRHQ